MTYTLDEIIKMCEETDKHIERSDFHKDALEYLKQYRDMRWHYPKNGDMPLGNKWVLVLLNDDTCTIGLYCSWADLKWIDNYENEIFERYIVAWMPLPNQPKEEV